MRSFAFFFLSWLVATAVACAGIAVPKRFEAHFVQTVTSPEGAAVRYEGDVRFVQPARMKWLYTKPERKEVCTDGRDLLIVEHALEQVSRYRLRKRFDLAEILKRAEHFKGRIYVATYEGTRYTLRLDAKGRLESAAYYDENDNKVQLVFTHIRTPKRPFSKGDLRCDYPASYDLIEG